MNKSLQSSIKRLFDVVAATLLLLLFTPLLLLLTLMLFIVNEKEVFFLQQRPGHHQKPFMIIKFKTMHDKKDSSGRLLPEANRVTALGSWMRHYSLDELPQLINVLKGEMSLVGPRPLLMDYVPLYNSHQQRRHDVKPGITGWAQVNGRDKISWKEKFDLDLFYVDNYSFALDMKIIRLTVIHVVNQFGISKENSPSIGRFKGN